jgi:hypothetical protein
MPEITYMIREMSCECGYSVIIPLGGYMLPLCQECGKELEATGPVETWTIDLTPTVGRIIK